MPNFVRNEVNMRNIGTLPIYSTNENMKNLNFDSIIESPDELYLDAGSYQELAMDEAMLTLMRYLNIGPVMTNNMYSLAIMKLEELHSNRLNKPYNSNLSRDTLNRDGMRYLMNIISYGYPTWYEWCIYNWGTKWNAMDTKIISNDVVTFTTAWNIPSNIYLKLSQMHPYDELTVVWTNEGGTCGVSKYLDGDCIECSEYLDIYGDDYDFDKYKLFTNVREIAGGKNMKIEEKK